MSDLSDLEAELLEIVLQAQKYPPQSAQRRRWCDRLFRRLIASNCLVHPNVPPQHKGSYWEIYNTAIQHLFEDLYKNIEKYDPARGTVLQWVNFLLGVRFPDAIREVTQLSKRANKNVTIYSLDDLDNEPQDLPDPANEPTARDVVNLLHDDPDDRFKTTQMTKYPQITFQMLALQRIEGYSWREISQQLSVPIPTLSAFYQRQIKVLLPHFQTYLQG